MHGLLPPVLLDSGGSAPPAASAGAGAQLSGRCAVGGTLRRNECRHVGAFRGPRRRSREMIRTWRRARPSTGSAASPSTCSSSAAGSSARRRGAREQLGSGVALVDRGDFASGTSSASSKLDPRRAPLPAHGRHPTGPRGPRRGRALVGFVAPHLVRRRRSCCRSTTAARTGGCRSAGARSSRADRVSRGAGSPRSRPGVAASLVPSLRLDGLRPAGVYTTPRPTTRASACSTSARQRRGRRGCNRVEVVAIGRGRRREVRDRLSGEH